MKTPEYLIDGWIEKADTRDLLELLGDDFAFELRRLIAATAKNVSLGVERNQQVLMVNACMLAGTVRAAVDHEYGERLRAGLAEAEAEEGGRVRRSTIGAVATL